MIKKIAVLLLASGNLMAMDCGLYYTYGTAPYAECQDRNSDRLNQQAQARIDNMNNQIAADDRARQANANIEDQTLMHPNAIQMPKLGDPQ